MSGRPAIHPHARGSAWRAAADLPSRFRRGRPHRLQQLGFGPRAPAHLFELRTEAEDVARRLPRRLSAKDHEYVAMEVAEEVPVS